MKILGSILVSPFITIILLAVLRLLFKKGFKKATDKAIGCLSFILWLFVLGLLFIFFV